MSRNGTYKILQVADLHCLFPIPPPPIPPLSHRILVSVSHGKCRDTDRTPCDKADDLTSDLLASVLDAEKPDFVVFTGDQLNGQGTSWDSRSVLAKFPTPVLERQIPWTAVFGNHDSETDMSREREVRRSWNARMTVDSALRLDEAPHSIALFCRQCGPCRRPRCWKLRP